MFLPSRAPNGLNLALYTVQEDWEPLCGGIEGYHAWCHLQQQSLVFAALFPTFVLTSSPRPWRKTETCVQFYSEEIGGVPDLSRLELKGQAGFDLKTMSCLFPFPLAMTS